jgi:hypothetical protein
LTAARNALSRLGPEELVVRARLAQRYGREFPPSSSFIKNANANRAPLPPLSKEQLIRSLIGRSIGGPFDNWSFDSPREFRSFKILEESHPRPLRSDYVVSMHVKGLHTGAEHDFKMQLTYGWFYTRWILANYQEID